MEIYGINPEHDFGAVELRNAIVECFVETHSHSINESLEDESIDWNKEELIKLSKNNAKQMVVQSFSNTGGNFEDPDKKSIIEALGELKKFSANFRGDDIVEENYKKLVSLAEKLPE